MIGCRIRCFVLVAAAVMCGAGNGAADSPEKDIRIAVVSIGGSGGAPAVRARASALHALMESLSALGAQVTGASASDIPPHGELSKTAVSEGRAAYTRSADLVIGLGADAVRRTGAYTAHQEMTVRAESYLIDGDGRPRIFRLRRERRLPTQCAAACLNRIGASMAREQARALAPKIFRWASLAASKRARRLAFGGFTPRELLEIRQYLRVFGGFQKMSRAERQSKVSVIRYLSRLDDRGLEAALGKMLGHMGIRAQVSRQGRGFTISRDPARRHPNAVSPHW